MIPPQTILLGNTISKITSTVGVNVLCPETENFVLDVNGPIKGNDSAVAVIKNIDLTEDHLLMLIKDMVFL